MKIDAENAHPFQFLLVSIAGWMNQGQQQAIDYLREENRVLRKQLGGRRVRFNDDQRRRLAVRAKNLGRKLLAEVASLVTPDTLLAWHRKLIAQKYDGRDKCRLGHPRTEEQLENVVIRMAEENRTWGYRRSQGAMSHLGYALARSTIADMLHRHGIEPAPQRGRKANWKEFLTQHWELIVAASRLHKRPPERRRSTARADDLLGAGMRQPGSSAGVSGGTHQRHF